MADLLKIQTSDTQAHKPTSLAKTNKHVSTLVHHANLHDRLPTENRQRPWCGHKAAHEGNSPPF